MSVNSTKIHPATSQSSTSVHPELMKGTQQEFQLLVCALGIYACYLRYGLLQERIYSGQHGPDGENYTFSLFLVTIQTLTNAIVALLILGGGLLTSKTHLQVNSTTATTDNGNVITTKSIGVIRGVPILDYFIVSLPYLSAMVFSFTALKYMSYPMQALGKSCKMIPVMLMGIVIRKRRYTHREFFCVFMITVGVALFSWKSKTSNVAPSFLGFALLFASLFMDGVTGPLQERLIARFSPSTHQLMFWQNICSVAWLSVALIVTGEGIRALSFVLKYPLVMIDVMSFSIVSALGQNFIFYTVRHFNALVVTTITTTRKMFTVLFSIFWFNHAMVPRQWIGLLFVFAAITWEAAAKQKAKKLKEVTQSMASTETKKES